MPLHIALMQTQACTDPWRASAVSFDPCIMGSACFSKESFAGMVFYKGEQTCFSLQGVTSRGQTKECKPT